MLPSSRRIVLQNCERAELREELSRTQQSIQNDVAACHERLGQQKIEDIQDLPCEVKQKIHNRDLKPSRVDKELRAELCKLQDTLQMATAGAGEKPLHKAQGDAVGKTKGGGNDDKYALASESSNHYYALLRVTGEREESLEKVLKDSRDRISNLNILRNNAEPESCSMGALGPSCGPEEVRIKPLVLKIPWSKAWCRLHHANATSPREAVTLYPVHRIALHRIPCIAKHDKLSGRKINVSFQNNFNVPIEVMIFILYSDEISIDVKTGLVTRHKNYFFKKILLLALLQHNNII